MSNKVEGKHSIGVFLPGVVVTLPGAGDTAVNRMGFGGADSGGDSSGQGTGEAVQVGAGLDCTAPGGCPEEVARVHIGRMSGGQDPD